MWRREVSLCTYKVLVIEWIVTFLAYIEPYLIMWCDLFCLIHTLTHTHTHTHTSLPPHTHTHTHTHTCTHTHTHTHTHSHTHTHTHSHTHLSLPLHTHTHTHLSLSLPPSYTHTHMDTIPTDIDSQLARTSHLLDELNQQQKERLSQAPVELSEGHLMLPGPSEEEVKIASSLRAGLVQLTAQVWCSYVEW